MPGGGIEPPTLGFSILRSAAELPGQFLEPTGIEPISHACKARILPLNDGPFSAGGSRTHDLSVMSGALHHWATADNYESGEIRTRGGNLPAAA